MPITTMPLIALTVPKNAPRPSGFSPRLVISQKAIPPAPSTSRTITPALAIEPVTKSQLKTALNRTTSPNKPPMRPHALRLSAIWVPLAPAMRLDRAVGREQAEDDDREEID